VTQFFETTLAMIFASLPERTRVSRNRFLRAVFVITVVFAAWEVLAFAAAKLLTERVSLRQADAIVVLSGSAVLRERVEKAAELYKEGLAPRIILTNDNQQGSWDNAQQRNPFFFEKSFDELVSRNVPKDAIEVLKTPVSSTHDEAQIVESYGRQHQFGSIMIITSDYHSRRALWTFHRVIGKGQISVGVEPVISTSPWSWWLHLSGWKSIPVELVKFVYYRLVY